MAKVAAKVYGDALFELAVEENLTRIPRQRRCSAIRVSAARKSRILSKNVSRETSQTI